MNKYIIMMLFFRNLRVLTNGIECDDANNSYFFYCDMPNFLSKIWKTEFSENSVITERKEIFTQKQNVFPNQIGVTYFTH